MKFSTKIVRVTAQKAEPVSISVSQQSQSEEETKNRLSPKVCSSRKCSADSHIDYIIDIIRFDEGWALTASGISKELTAEQVHLLVRCVNSSRRVYSLPCVFSSTASLACLAGMTWSISDLSSPIAMSATTFALDLSGIYYVRNQNSQRIPSISHFYYIFALVSSFYTSTSSAISSLNQLLSD